MFAISVLVGTASRSSNLTWTCTGACNICYVLLQIFKLRQPEMCFLQGVFPLFCALFLPSVYSFLFILIWYSCLEERCSAEHPCFFERTGTNFQCQKCSLKRRIFLTSSASMKMSLHAPTYQIHFCLHVIQCPFMVFHLRRELKELGKS